MGASDHDHRRGCPCTTSPRGLGCTAACGWPRRAAQFGRPALAPPPLPRQRSFACRLPHPKIGNVSHNRQEHRGLAFLLCERSRHDLCDYDQLGRRRKRGRCEQLLHRLLRDEHGLPKRDPALLSGGMFGTDMLSGLHFSPQSTPCAAGDPAPSPQPYTLKHLIKMEHTVTHPRSSPRPGGTGRASQLKLKYIQTQYAPKGTVK